ncbi:hypothetical protein ACJMK2_039343 [Sinanodonta woodiana]|uniref:EF-hand domain-containing protein n=1 Tax=Sinanodonta woodiana TaxID=1069815 RepID=A0ABD3WCK0_SINWO
MWVALCPSISLSSSLTYSIYDNIRNFLIVVHLTRLLATVPTAAAHTDTTKSPSVASLFFDSYDNNPKDGVISDAEFHKAAYRYDLNVDGNITRYEFAKLYQARLGTSQHQGEEAFDAVDLNHDGTFDDNEITAVYKVFDANGDGQITPEEFLVGFSHLFSGHVTTSG